jgi:hypothetical protein
MPAADRASKLPLPALLSQLLVAFTVELDNEFERQMVVPLSLVVWANLMRFLADHRPVAVAELAERALCPLSRVRAQIGCFERWRFVMFERGTNPDETRSRKATLWKSHMQRREGWGSGRSIRAEWRIVLTPYKGDRAVQIWTPLIAQIEERWQQRFGTAAVGRLRASLEAVVAQIPVELPHGVPVGLLVPEAHNYPPRVSKSTQELSLPALLSQALLAFANDFEREAGVSLALCANAIRVLGREPVRAAEIPRLTGSSPETSGLGWQLAPFVSVEPAPAGARGKVVRLSPCGLEARQKYHMLVDAIELEWQDQYGKRAVGNLRQALVEIREQRDGDRWRLSTGLVPPAGVARAGVAKSGLGRLEVDATARKRCRDLVAQSDAFVRDPLGTLPHYPLWDMNRGFGP